MDEFGLQSYEYGEYITTIDENNDENHPYKHGVEFAGEHKILCVNNDTFERVMIKIEVTPYHQKYIPIEWNKHQFIWKQTKDTIQNEDDIDNLVFWGKALFEGGGVRESERPAFPGDVRHKETPLSSAALGWPYR